MTNITDTHKEFFENMGEYNNLALFSCFVNGEPTAAISAVEYDQDSEEYIISPVAVFVTEGMVIEDHEGTKA